MISNSPINWLSADKAPKDGTMIIARFKNYPTPLADCWNGIECDWVAAVPHIEPFFLPPYIGKFGDWYFESEHFQDSDLESWREI